MLGFTSPAYLAFLGVSAVLYRFCPLRLRAAYLLALSYLFYMSYNLWAAALLAGATLATFTAARLIDNGRTQGHRWTRLIVAISVIGLTGLLGFYKIVPLTGARSLVVPLGVSYYTFKLISYVVDVYWEKYRAGTDLLGFSLYVVFFPQIVAGPIQRPGDFLAQLPSASPSVSEGVLRIVAGLYKKLLIADNLGISVSYVYTHMTSLTGAPLLLGFWLFPLQLYVDFSGLTDIAIGSGLLFGIRGPENFDRPFSATSISGYWRRWHMSLTTWLTDYVFTPLRMATRNAGQWGLALSIAINMISIGLWHGLTWTYFAFGCTHAIYLIVDALSAGKRRKFFKRRPELNEAGDWLGWGLTMFLVAIAAVFFRARSLSDAGWLFAHVANLSNLTAIDWTGLINPAGVRGVAIGLAGYAVLDLLGRFDLRAAISRAMTGAPRWVHWFRYAAAAMLLIFSLLLLLAQSSSNRAAFLYEIF